MGGMGRAGCRAECATSTRSHKPARLVHTCLPRVLTPCSASLRTRPLCAVHRLVLLLPIALPASRHRSHGSVMPLVPPRHHSLHCMSAHDIRRTLTACPIAPTSIHVACSFSPSELVVPLLDLGLRFWPRPPSNTPPLDLALSIARTDPPPWTGSAARLPPSIERTIFDRFVFTKSHGEISRNLTEESVHR